MSTFSRWLENLLADCSITDVLINKYDQVFIDDPAGIKQVASPFASDHDVEQFARQLIEQGEGHLDFANPIWDVSLDLRHVKLRVHAALAAGIAGHPCISIRVHRENLVSFEQLEALGMVTRQQSQQLHDLVRSNQSFIISGATGSGKTTLLKALLMLDNSPRTLVLEDSVEIMPLEGHFVGLNSRAANTEGYGQIELQKLLVESLRMRPDRLVIGEVRSVEVVTLLEALNLGVSNVACTIHANTSSQVVNRLLALWLRASRTRTDLQVQLAGQSLVAIHVERVNGVRSVTTIEQLAIE